MQPGEGLYIRTGAKPTFKAVTYRTLPQDVVVSDKVAGISLYPSWRVSYAVGMSQHANDQPADMPGITRVTVEEAAKLLGLSGNAVRKRLERGSLRSEKVDGIRYVLLESDMSQHADDMSRHAEHMSDGMPGDIALMQEHLDSMNEQIEYLKGVIAKRDEEIRRRDHLLAAALERIPPALEAPERNSPEPREEPETASPEMEGVETPIAEEQRRSWLQRFFFGP